MKCNLSRTVYLLMACLMALSNARATTITDDFSDLDDTNNPTWTHLTGLTLSTGQVFDASTGEYHITAPANGATINGVQYGFAGSYVQPSFGDVNVMADLVEPSSGLAYGVGAHLNGVNTPGGLKGYGYFFEQDPVQSLGVGEMVFYRIVGLSLSDIGNDGPAQRAITLDLANKDYTFSLDVIGNTLYGTVTEVGGGVVAYQQKTDLSAPAGFPTSGFSGLLGVGAAQGPLALPVDMTWDNFKTQDVPEPTSGLLLLLGSAGLGWLRRRCR
jgi:PEP-CTERM motif